MVNLGTGHNQTALGNNVLNAAATVRDLASMGWVVSSDKTTDATGEYKDVVKNANEVKFVGKNAAKVSGKTDPKTGIRTITVDVEAPDVKTAELVSSKDGSVIAPSTNPELQKALKDAKDELAALPKEATPEQKEAAENKVKAAETALNNAVDNKGVATAKNVADMINASGFTLKTSATADGKKESGDDEVINPGKAVEMVAGKNLTVKQEANGKVAYSTKDEVEFNTVKLGDAKDGKAPVNMKTEAAKPATNNGADQPTTALNFTSGEGDKAKPTQLTGVGSTLNTQDIVTAPQGKDNTNKPNVSLVNLVGTDDAPVNKNAAATVGDLQNMGWVVSTKDGNGYKDVVKNANQVDFKGTGLATVTGETKDGIRTITVNVDAQKTVEAAQNPVVYTDSEGNKVTKLGDNFYPVEEAKDAVKIGDNYYPAGTVLKDGKPVDSEGNEATALVPTDKKTVKASMNNGDNKAAPTVLSNVGSNLPTVDDVKKQAFNPNDSKNPLAKKSNKAAPITALEAAELLDPTSDKFAGNNAATVSDVLNAGWNLQNNGEARDFVKPYDTVNFINGKGTVAVVETADDAASSTVKFDVDAGEITSNTNGSVNGPTTAENAKKLADDLKKAEQAVKDLPTDATEDKKAEAQKALKDAQDAAAPLNKVATAQNVADMINASGFTLKTSKAEGGEKDAASTGDEVINPGKAVEMVAGKNLTVKQEANGKVTYSTKDDVEFNTVKLGDAKDGKAPVNMKTEAAKPATNNGADQPTTALNISSSDGKPTQITGVGSTLNVKPVDTNTNGTPTADADKPNLVDLVGTKDAPVNKNAAATVGDLQNMGWVVSAKDNNYTNTVKNANKVEFKGDKGISVTGKDVTQADGTVTREITVAIADGKVTDKVTITKDGKDIPAIKIGDNYYEVDKNGKPVGYEVDEKGKPTANNKPIDVTDATITNEGNKVVTGNTVATAIQESGWNVGLADSSKANEAFNDSSKALSADKLEKVNPDDNVRFADGKNTKVQAATMDEVNKDGKKITNTYVRFNVDLPISQITSEDKDGNKVAKAADGKWYPVKEGKPDTTKEALEPSNVRTSASMDPDGLGDKYTSTTSREEGLTPTQLGELTGKQEAAAKAAEEKIKDLLKGQSKDVIEAASKAAVDAAKEEAKVQYLKDNGLDKGTGGTVISNVAWGTKPSDAVNVDQLQNSGINVHSRTVEGSTGKVISGNTSPTKVKMDETVNVDAGNNIEITRNGRDIAIATSMTPKFDSVQFGKEGPKITNKAGNINVSGPDGKTPTKITGVAPGEISATSKDAINGSQLHAVASNLNNKINKVGKHADAGTASALAAANIPQAYTPGKSLVGIAAGNYQGQNGLAVGMSRISDNGKIIIRLSGTANSQGKTGVAAGVGYQW